MNVVTQGDRVTFNAREYGHGHPQEGTWSALTGTVTRPVWGRAKNVTIVTDDGRTFVRLLHALRPVQKGA